MKILVVCQHYWPEPYPLHDVCEELVHRGHTVHVVAGVPNYPMGVIYPEYRKRRNRYQDHNGVEITRVFTIGRRNNIIFRFLNYYCYQIFSTLYTRRIKEEYDVVFANQTSPVMMVAAGMAYSKKWGKNTVLYCMDLWPASLAAGGVSKRNPIYKIFWRVSKQLYCKSDRLLISSQMFREYLRSEFNIKDGKIGYLPQYADSLFSKTVIDNKARKETIDLLFAGNVGAAQSMSTIFRAAYLLKDHPELRWHIVGDGSELENSKRMVQQMGLNNVIFYGRKPIEEIPGYYAKADAMLVTLTADKYISLTLPGKVQTYMAAGKPIIGAANGEISNTIETSRCGFCAKAEDARGLAEAVRTFLNCRDKDALGENARSYYQTHFTRDIFMDTLEAELKDYSK